MTVHGDGDSSSDVDSDVIWVLKAALNEVSNSVERGFSVSKEKIDELLDPDEVADDAVLIPLDMSEASLHDLDDLAEQIGATKVAELLIRAREAFLDNLEAMPVEDQEDVPQELTGADYKLMMDEEMAKAAAEAEESEMEGSTNEGPEESEEGSADAEDEQSAGDEPPTKKQKTD